MLNDLLAGALAELPDEDPAEDLILDGALDQVVAFGFRHTTMDDVARRAGVGRMTVYRRFATRERLLRRLLAREFRRAVRQVARAAEAETDFAERVVAAFVATLRLSFDHPLLDRLIRLEPDALVDLAQMQEPDLLALARQFVAAELASAQRAGQVGHVDPQEVAEVVIRLVVSFVVVPRSAIDISDEAACRRFARSTLLPILTGARPSRS